MTKSEFEEKCALSDKALTEYKLTSDGRRCLKDINDNINIVRVTRLVKRTRMLTCSALAVFAGAGIVAGGIISRDAVMIIIAAVLGMVCASVGVWWFVSHVKSVTHKAVCVSDGGKVREFIFSAKGGFIYNTIEGEITCDRGKVNNVRHNWTSYQPSYPYVDFLDRDFSNYLKARSGEGYDSGLSYVVSPETGQIGAFSGDNNKKRVFCLTLSDGRPDKFEYGTDESYIYSRLNEAGQTVFIPRELKGKLTFPSYLNVEWVDAGQDFKTLWKRI